MSAITHRTARATLVAVALVALAGAAEARPDLRQMTCAQAQAMVQRHGAVVFTTGRFTFQRFVASRRFCDRGQALTPAYARTRDTAQCPVGYLCEEPLFPRWERWND
ncbi:hypothetical protein [Polymorphum gilvum]|uniref:Uncharacterized protein n=1 Tax=Polymorphum gilvum (strain LMG 25793 / CGMCC 1.9160 / SL003B-26A1) TaxID=991905 RepID=F2IUY2_POLGS|nr:hypothetical protein [Polymorphum gilvum]ADZ70211.1 hypothetical protein SL003B_1784 [Polymorphum gilvum SL003B-26A1]